MKEKLLRYSLFWVAALWLSVPTNAQQAELDSLEQLAANSTDTVRIDALIELGIRLRKIDLEHSAEKFIMAREEAEKSGDQVRQLRAANRLGISYGMIGDYAKALEQFNLGLRLHTAAGNLLGMAESYNNLGIVYKYTGDYSRSLEIYNLALPLYDSIGNRLGRGACLHNIGVVSDMMGEEENALDFFQQALEIKKKESDELDYSLTLHSIALVYEKQGKYEESLRLLFEHLDIMRKYDDQVREAAALNTIGKLYVSIGSVEAAETYLLQSREKCLSLGLKEPLAHTFYNLAKIRLMKNEPQSAIPYLEQQLSLGAGLNSFVLQKQGHDLIAEAYSQKGDYRSAFQHLLTANTFRDSLFNAEKNQSFQQWQSRLDVYEKDRQLGEQELELQWMGERRRLDGQLRWALVIGLLLAIAVAILFFQKYKLRQRANQTLEEKNQRIEAQRTEIERMNYDLEKRMLRSQMNPHFIFNSLGSIQHFITTNDRGNALRFLSKFSNLLRQVLEDSVANNIVLEEEVQLLKTYLDLEALRFDQNFSYDIHLETNLDPYTTEMPILLVQPFLENAILHGLLPKSGERKLDIYFSEENGYTICRITDNGIGRAAAADLKARKSGGHRPSRGIEVAQKRLQALDKNQSIDSLLIINDLLHSDGTAAGTEVIVKIPIN